MGSELVYWIFNTPYYRIKIVKDMEILKTFTRKVLEENDKNSSDFLISEDMRKCWIALKNNCFRDGKAFECYADVDNCIPLIDSTKILEMKKYMNGLITKEVSIKEVKISSPIVYGQNVEIKQMREIPVNPEFVFRLVKQNIAQETLTEHAMKIDKKYIIAALIIVVGLYVWFVVLGGHMPTF